MMISGGLAMIRSRKHSSSASPPSRPTGNRILAKLDTVHRVQADILAYELVRPVHGE
jgi:hypothetical protein